MLLCLLSMFALPMETAAHKRHPKATNNPFIADVAAHGLAEALRRAHAGNQVNQFYDRLAPWADLSECINWVRVYKNPKATPTSELGPPTGTFQNIRQWRMPGVVTGATWLRPSIHWEEIEPGWDALGRGEVWVNLNTEPGDDYGSLIDTGENSGLVTATENTTVKRDDRVAIAVNFNTWGAFVRSDMSIGPRQDVTYKFQHTRFVPVLDDQGNTQLTPDPNDDPDEIIQKRIWFNADSVQREGPWRLNPNATLEEIGSARRTFTIVYQFVVGEEHALLNKEPWLQQDFYYTANTGRDPGVGYNVNNPGSSLYQPGSLPVEGNRSISVDWLYGKPEGELPSASAVKPWNTFDPADIEKQIWDALGTNGDAPGWPRHRYTNYGDFTRAHVHIPMYDPKDKETIYYPKVVVGNTDNGTTVSLSTAITDVPTGTQTGEFQVTLGFSEVQEIADFTIDRRTFAGVRSAIVETGVPLIPPPNRSIIPVPGASVSIFVAHDVSETGVNDFKEELTTALAAADPPWTVTEMAYAGGVEIAASGKMGPRNHGTATRYTLTLSPPLGVKGEFALQIPAGVVSDAAGTPNAASEAVMVSVDTSLRLAAGAAVEIVEPESGTYLGGDALEVRVPFAADGLTYEGNNPPYITIYLGEETSANARHATWQRGAETSGSTIVPFVYVVNAADPVVSSVVVGSEGLSVPEGTTLRSGSGLSLVGSDDADSGQAEISTASGESFQGTEREVNVSPVLWVPTEESDPKAAASSVPRTPIVFNELGNGSGAANDWLELRNVTDAAVSLKDWELSIVADAKQEDTSLVVFSRCECAGEWLVAAHEHAFGQDPSRRRR